MSDEQTRDEPPEVVPVEEPPRRQLTCWYCGSADLIKGLELGLTSETGSVGIKFHASGQFLGMSLLGNEPLRVTLCAECGTVVRLSVRSPDRNWA